ncbi:MAG: hypothetical protein ACWGQW_09430 [bacterium]
MSEEKKDLYMYQDRGGRFYLGIVQEESVENRTVVLKKVLTIQERVLPTQTQEQQQIMLNLAPIMHTFTIDTWEFQWIGRHRVVDPQLVNTHEKFWAQIRAARSGISAASSVPPGLANAMAPGVARAVQG